MKWRIRHSGDTEDTVGDNDRSAMKPHNYEKLECAGCSHPIVNGQEFVAVLRGGHYTEDPSQRRTSWRESLTAISASLAAGAAALTSGLEHALNSAPPQLREFLSSHRDAIKGLGASAASVFFAGSKQAVLFLRGTPHIYVIAASAILVVVASSGAIYAHEKSHKRQSSQNVADPLYYHTACPGCAGRSCFRPLPPEGE